MTPSVKTIMCGLGDTLRKEYGDKAIVQAKNIRLAMQADWDPDNALDEINKILKGYGVEAIRDNDWASYFCDIGLLYVNLGDTYIPTVVYDTRKKRFIITSWGNIIESNERRFNV